MGIVIVFSVKGSEDALAMASLHGAKSESENLSLSQQLKFCELKTKDWKTKKLGGVCTGKEKLLENIEYFSATVLIFLGFY